MSVTGSVAAPSSVIGPANILPYSPTLINYCVRAHLWVVFLKWGLNTDKTRNVFRRHSSRIMLV